MGEEVWKSVGVVRGIDFTGLYEVSNMGQVRSLNATIIRPDGTNYTRKGTLLKQNKDKTGYFKVSLSYIKRYTCAVHELVMKAFCPNPDTEIYTDINHIDEDKTNNRLDNLEWTTHKENMNYGTRNKRLSKSLRETVGRKVVQLDLNLKFVKEWDSVAFMRETTEYSWGGIQCCLCKTSKSCCGYVWVYAEDYYSGDYLTFYNEEYMQNKRFRKIVQMDLDYNFIKQWNSIAEAARNGFTRSGIDRCVCGERKKSQGFRWMYLEDYKKMCEQK